MITKDILQIKGIKRTLALLAFLSIMQGAALLMQATYLAKGIVHLFNGENLESQVLPFLLFMAAYLARQALAFLKDKWMDRFAAESGSAMRKELLGKILGLGPRFTQREGTGSLVTLALEGVTQTETYLKLFLPKLTAMVIIPAMTAIYMAVFDLVSAGIVVGALPILLFFLAMLGIAARRKADRQYESYQALSNHFTDSLRGLETLKLLGLSKKYDKNIEEVSERYRKSTMATLRVAFLSTFALDFFTSLSIAIVALFLGLRLIEGEMFLNPALTVLILAPEFFLPIREFGTDYHATLDGKNSLSAIRRITNWPVHHQEGMAPIPEWTEESEVTFSNVCVRHEGASADSLQATGLSWKGFGKIGIIGASGAGKSTLIDILGGFLEPTAGTVTINGQPYSHLSCWRDQILYIPQHPYIFNDTVRNNIAFYTPGASEEAIERAVKEAGLDELVESLPSGLDEQIGESGRALSGGQEQRIALARGILDSSRKILLFDEPTAHLDIETEYELKKNIMPLFENRLVFFATHRLHWMTEMDLIIVMDQGRIVETGSHEELLSKRGFYFRLAENQSRKIEVKNGHA